MRWKWSTFFIGSTKQAEQEYKYGGMTVEKFSIKRLREEYYNGQVGVVFSSNSPASITKFREQTGETVIGKSVVRGGENATCVIFVDRLIDSINKANNDNKSNKGEK